jgi:hypothetical protein
MEELEKDKEVKEEVKDNSLQNDSLEEGALSEEDVKDIDFSKKDDQEKDESESDDLDLMEVKAPQEDEESEEEPLGDTLTPTQDNENIEESIDSQDEGENGEEVEQVESEEKMLTQSQVNELVGKARQEGRESAMKELLGRYGVGTEDEMNDIFGRGQAYDDLNDEFVGQTTSLKNVMAENALLKTNILEDRWDDVRLILNGKGLDVTKENIEAMLSTHPEWKGSVGGDVVQPEQNKILTPEMGEQLAKQPPKTPSEPQGTLRKLGTPLSTIPQESEDDMVKRLFGLDK